MRSLNDVHIHEGTYYKTCCICGYYFKTKKSHLNRRKTCSSACDGFRKKTMYDGAKNPNYGNRGAENPIYKSGSYITNYGYRMILKHGHPNANKQGYVFEHRYVVSQHLGRPLLCNELVHHKDHNKLNNDIENLELTNRESHSSYHSTEDPQPRCDKTGVFISRRTNI